MGLLMNFKRSGKIDVARININNQLKELHKIASNKNDEVTKSFLETEVCDVLTKINDAYLQDRKYTKALMLLFQTVEECLEKIRLVYSHEESSRHEELFYLLLDFLNEKYLSKGRKGNLSLQDVEDFRDKFFNEYFPLINDLTEKLSKQRRLLNKLQDTYDTYKKIKSESSDNQGVNKKLTLQANNVLEEYNKLVNFIDDFDRFIFDKSAELNLLLKKDLSMETLDESGAAASIDNASQIKELQQRKDSGHKLVEEAKRDVFGDASEELIPIEQSEFVVTSSEVPSWEKKVENLLEKMLDGKFATYTKPIIGEIKLNRRLEQSHHDKTAAKIKELKDLVKLNNEELVKTIADLFEKNIKRQEAGEPEASSNEESLAYETELAKRIAEHKLTTKETIDLLVNLDPPKYVGAYALIRTLIDSYCRFGRGIELNDKQRIFKPVDSSGNVLNTNYDVFRFVFGGKADPAKVNNIWNGCNPGVHGNLVQLGGDEAKIVEKVKAYSKFVLEDLGLDYSKIDYVKGAKKLYEKEIKDINNLVDGKYEESQLSRRDVALDKIHQCALGRINALKNYLTGKVEPEFFASVGKPKMFAKTNK